VLLGALVLILALAPPDDGPRAQDAEEREALKASLLARWEQAQREDPQTLRFERIGERRYRFATERFPFDGELQVVNLSIDGLEGWVADGYRIGVVEIQLMELPTGFLQRHAHSVSQWRSHHQFYADTQGGEWLTAAEWQRALTERAQTEPVTGGSLGCIVNWVYVVLIVVFVLAVAVLVRKASRQFRSATSAQDEALAGQRRALELSEQALDNARESREILTEIRDLLRELTR
jgi:hypothetical protein